MRAVGRDQLDAEGLQLGKANLLNHQVACEATGGLDNDGTSAVAGDVGEHGCEPGPRLDMVGAANRCVVELANKLVTGGLGEGCDGLTLALVAVFIGADVCSAGCADVGYCLGLEYP